MGPFDVSRGFPGRRGHLEFQFRGKIWGIRCVLLTQEEKPCGQEKSGKRETRRFQASFVLRPNLATVSALCKRGKEGHPHSKRAKRPRFILTYCDTVTKNNTTAQKRRACRAHEGTSCADGSKPWLINSGECNITYAAALHPPNQEQG